MTTTFPEFVAERFGGKLSHGAHQPNGVACLHEALNVYQGKDWSDDTTGTLDLRSLNDAPWSSDEARTEAMLPLGAIVLTWPSWSEERRVAWAKLVAEGVIRRILPPTLRAVAERVPSKAPELVAAALRCETEGDESAAESAAESVRSAAWSAAESARSAAYSARSAAWSAAESAAWSAAESARSAAWSAADSARSAAWSAARSAWAARDIPLQTLCSLMVEAAEQTEDRP
ncbi:MAG TPA: hypothetical protein VFW03_09155 [Gemmatimonadaceae bacterium]|nr:hypothetical protein [Gemmatimonadaceae bacterium]